jgi:hypothetical protein
MIRKSFIVALMAVILVIPVMAQGQGNGNGNGQKGKWNPKNRGPGSGFDSGIGTLLKNLPVEEISTREQNGLTFMREEEKLARDVYAFLFETWNIRIFRNISRSENRHMEGIKVLLDKYGLPDPVADDIPGVFSNPELQALYHDLTAQGAESLEAALQMGALIEDLDIYDLKRFLKKTNNSDIKTLYHNLMKGSRNHLRAFVGQLQRFGLAYTGEYLSQEEIQEILDSPMERGVYDENGEPIYGGMGW